MKIAIDGYEANIEQRLGSSQIAYEVIKNLEKIDKKNDYTIFLPTQPLADLPKSRDGWNYKILKPKTFWTRIVLPLALYTTRKKLDLIFSPTHYIPRFSPVKRVVTIFDLSFIHFPEMFTKRDLWQLKNWTKFSVEFADHIITISNFSKQDIIKQYGISKEKITVAYPGYDADIFRPQKDQRKIKKVFNKYGISSNYIIYIGTVQPRKNLIRLIEAFSRVILKRSDRISNKLRDSSATPKNDKLQLVIVGKAQGLGRQGWMFEDILATPKRLGIEDRVIFTGFIPQQDLPDLLSGAIAFIEPSLWEGFGIPVVEAMVCGTPVIVSNVSSLPEVVGQAGLLVNPYSVDQIEQAIRTILSDKKLRERKSKEGLEQAKKFSWDKMTRIVLKTLTSLL